MTQFILILISVDHYLNFQPHCHQCLHTKILFFYFWNNVATVVASVYQAVIDEPSTAEFQTMLKVLDTEYQTNCGKIQASVVFLNVFFFLFFLPFLHTFSLRGVFFNNFFFVWKYGYVTDCMKIIKWNMLKDEIKINK